MSTIDDTTREALARLPQIREVFVDSLLEQELHEQASEHQGALVSLTDEYKAQIESALGEMFDATIEALKVADRARLATAIEDRAADDGYVWVSGRQALNHAAGIVRGTGSL